MQVLVKPKPNDKFFKLSARESSLVAMRVAKEAGNGATDWQVFREWTQAWKNRNRTRNLTLL
jgi:hypothetical protein